MNLSLVILLIILILFTIGFMYIEPMISKHKVKNDNEYGSARFATKEEIKKNFKKEKIGNIIENGVPIIFSKDLKYMWVDRETPHYVYLGSTGSGKSVTAVIPFCSFTATAKNKRSVFITDPKGEIYNTTSKMFKDNNYNVYTIDFRHPELSNKFNILTPIINEYKNYIKYEDLSRDEKDEIKRQTYINISMTSLAETNRLITSLASMITSEKVEAKDPFWNNSAKNLLEGLIGFFLEEYKNKTITEEKITMTSIRKFQNSTMGSKNSSIFRDYINNKEYGMKSKDSLTSIISASDNTKKSIESVFGSKMAIFDDINVANVTSSSDFEFDILGREPTALYVIVPDEDKTYYTLVTIIVGLLYRELVKLANKQKNKKLPVQIDWILDEFANCPALADIEAIVSVARSRGMRFHFFIQSFSQLDNVYGKDVSQIILDNCGLIYLKTNTQDTAEAISKRLGKKTIESSSINQSISLLDYNGHKNTSLIARELMTPDEVKQLHYKTIIFPIVGYPIIRDTVVYDKFKCYSSGEVIRNINSLEDLNYTYFTVEDLEKEEVENKKLIPKEQEEMKQMEQFDKDLLSESIEILKKELRKTNFNFKYSTAENYRVYMTFTVNNKLSQKEISSLITKLDKERYKVFINFIANKTIIEVHNILNFDVEQDGTNNV